MLRRLLAAIVAAVAVIVPFMPEKAMAATSVAGPYEIRFLHSGKCLDVAGASPFNVQLTQYTCTGAYNTHWYLDYDGDYFLLRNRATGLCANISGNIYLNNQPVIQWTCNKAYNNERFKRSSGPDGYRIQSWLSPNKVIHQQGNQQGNNAPVSLWEVSSALNTQVLMTLV